MWVRPPPVIQINIMKKVEIERKFLLRNIPKQIAECQDTTVLLLEQFYVPYKYGTIRYRRTLNWKTREQFFEKIIKNAIEPGINIEEILTCTEDEYWLESKKQVKKISKFRHILTVGYKLEIDYFKDMHLIVLEIELNTADDLKTELHLPLWLKDEIIVEVTGMKEFSNYNLAK